MGLYDNLRPELVIEAVECAIEELRPGRTHKLKTWIISLVRFSLGASFAKYGDSWYKGLKGIPTGGFICFFICFVGQHHCVLCTKKDSLLGDSRTNGPIFLEFYTIRSSILFKIGMQVAKNK